MKVYYELDLNSFEAWSGAVDTLERIKAADKTAELEAILDDTYPEGMSETELNDLLWFDPDLVYSWVGLRSESEIKEELNDLREELDDLEAEYYDECIGIADWERKEIWEEDYKERADELKEQIDELEAELAEI